MNKRADNMRAVNALGRQKQTERSIDRALHDLVERHQHYAELREQLGQSPAQTLIDKINSITSQLKRGKP